MAVLKQSTAYTRKFLMVLSSDHLTGATGLSPVVSLSKATATTFTTATGTVAEVAGGWYQIPLATSDTNTLGELAFHCTTTATTADPTDWVDQVTANILGDTFSVIVTTNNDKTGYTLSNTGIDALFTRQLTEAYAADGVAPTVAQFLFAIQQFQQEKVFTATQMLVKKLDGTTTALTLQVDNATTPTTITRTL